ncbi:MAG: BT4734/BF3469 family protein [Bacteroidota bacterium]
MNKFSVFASDKGISQTIPTDTLDIKQCAESIRTLKYLIEKTTDLRSITDIDAQQEFKKTLPYVTFSGTFSKRANDKLISHSGYICIDLDKLKDTTIIAKQVQEYYTPALMFVSPSGNGLKVVFAIDINEATHLQYFTALETFFKVQFSLPIDKACKDVSRACFLCHDPDVFFSDTPDILDSEFISKGEKTIPIDETLTYDDAKKWTETKESFINGNRNQFIFTLADCCNRYQIPEQEALSKIISDFAIGDFTAEEITTTVESRYKLHPDWHGIAKTNSPPVGKNPYIRVGVDYFKVINKKDRYGIERRELKRWTKDALITDFKRGYLKTIPKYDDFVQVPDNQNYQGVINNCYNMYAPFCHTPAPGEWAWTKILLEQVFGEQYGLGLRYMQILYCYPKRPAPILALVSSKQKTGKTTFVNWISMLFGSNSAQINAGDFQSMFNGQYATKNIVMIEESMFDKKITIERLKAIATAKQLSVNRKNIDQFNLDYFGKIILTSNYEDKFAQVSSEETRFFVRKLEEPKHKRNTIESDLLTEIPAFLDYLATLPPVSDEVDRSGFTSEELRNEFLDAVKEESKHETSKELKIMFAEYFDNHENITGFYASATDIKTKFFVYDNRTGIAWLLRVLKDDFGLNPGKLQKYIPFGDPTGVYKAGRPYCFNRNNFTKDKIDEIPF